MEIIKFFHILTDISLQQGKQDHKFVDNFTRNFSELSTVLLILSNDYRLSTSYEFMLNHKYHYYSLFKNTFLKEKVFIVSHNRV